MGRLYVNAHLFVSGIVQGVNFRYFTYLLAKAYGLKGFVRNLFDGRVEIEVEGDERLIRDFIKEIGIGPRAAVITGVDVEWNEYTGRYEDFSVRF